MRLRVIVRRRFCEQGHVVQELVRAVELALPPVSRQCLVFPDGVEIVISKVRMRVGLPSGLGLQPIELEVICTKEPATRLPEAEQHGWQRIRESNEPVAVAPVS